MRSTLISAQGLAVSAAFVAFAIWSTVWAQDTVTVQADGSITVAVLGEQFLIPAPVAEAVESALEEHADDPASLTQAIRTIVSNNAGTPSSAGLATAIGTLAVFLAGSESPSIVAILLGATQGNNAVSGESLITAIPELRKPRSSGEAFEENLVRANATVENPFQVSPVQQ